MKFKLILKWYDMWIGFFYDKKKNWLYILPIPMCGIILMFPQKRYWLISNRDNKTVIGSTVKSELEYCYKQDNVHSKMYWTKNGETKPLFGKDFDKDNE